MKENKFTGLHDKNGKEEICNGSIITFLPSDDSTKIPQTAEVYYCNKRAAFCIRGKGWNMPILNCKDIEIIGNKFDNPKLKEG